MSLPLLNGDLINIEGLKNRANLNGEYAVIEGRLDNGRLQVQLIKSKTNLFLSPENTLKVDSTDEVAMEELLRKNQSKSMALPLSPNSSVLLNNSALNFYPLGSSPAKFLLERVPIDAVRANILLLGCGDSRHILFTCVNNLLNGKKLSLMLDVTMCDMEPSIHARNIIFSKTIIDNSEMNKIWCVYYATAIDDFCLTLLQKYAEDLYNIGEDLQTWLASDIDPTLVFHLAHAYAEIKRTSTSTPTSKLSEGDIYKICFDQFQDWCNGFKDHVIQS
eukprot:gene3012-5902_t